MGTDAAIGAELRSIIDAALAGVVSEAQAARVYELGRDAVSALVLAAARRIAELRGNAVPGPHAPSGSIPPFAKPLAPKRRRGRPGARDGHEGHRRPAPPPDRVEEVPPLTVCPDCHGPVLPARRKRRRIVEDMPEDTRVEATEYVIPGHWCPQCKKHVEPKVSAALPNSTIGNNLAALTCTFHFGLGLTLEQTREVLLSPLRTHVSAGGLVDLWRRIAEVLLPWYEQVGREARRSAVLHADETGWRVDGQTHWLWCFGNHATCFYLIDEGRGSGVLKRFFTEAFKGVLVHDFWRPYESVLLEGDGEHQCCLAHLLRELDHVDEHALPHKSPDRAREWCAFVKMLRRLLRDGVRLRRRKDFTPARYATRIARIDRRLTALTRGPPADPDGRAGYADPDARAGYADPDARAGYADPDARAGYADPDARRLAARLRRHQDELFTFLDRPEADWNNNLAERLIRPAVILRKNSQCNRSQRGAATQAVLMTIYRTLRLRGHDPRQTLADALAAHAATGTLPPLPSPIADG